MITMVAYQIRQGKPQVGYYGTGPGPQDYQAMAEYLQLKKLRKNIRTKCHMEDDTTDTTQTQKTQRMITP